MNKIYRVVWNQALNQWVVASEISRSEGKRRSSQRGSVITAMALALLGANMGMAETSLNEGERMPFSLTPIAQSVTNEYSAQRAGWSIGSGKTEKQNNAEIANKGDLRLDGTLELSGSGIFQNGLSGGSSGLFTIMSGGDIILKNANRNYQGSYKISKDGQLTINDALAMGDQNVATIDGTLVIKDVKADQLSNKLMGEGLIKLINTDISIHGYSGGLTGFHGMMDIDKDSIYRFNERANTFNIHHNLRGEGIYQIDMGANSQFGFDWDTDLSGFTGIMELKSGIIEFNNDHNAYLNKVMNGTIEVGSAGTLRITSGLEKQAKSLILNGGTIDFTAQYNGFEKLIIRENIEVKSGVHHIKVNGDLFTDNATPTGNYFDQQKGTITHFLIQGNSATKEEGAEIHLYDLSGKPIEGKSSKIRLADETGNAYYGVGKGMIVTDGKPGENGIGFGSTLLELEADNQKLITVNNRSEQQEAFGVKLSGDGGFIFNPNGTITLTNQNNSYRGETIISGGRVLFGVDNSFGNTNHINLKQSGALNLAHYSQNVAELDSDQSSHIHLASGSLTVTDRGDIKGTLESGIAGQLEIAKDGSLNIHSSNQNFLGNAYVKEGATLIFHQHDSLGDNASVDLQGGTLLFTDRATGDINYSIKNSNSDPNSLIKLDKNAAITFTDKVDHSLYSGSFLIDDQATLTIKDQRALGVKASNKTTINEKATLVIDGVQGSFFNQFIGDGAINLINNANLSFSGDYSAYNGMMNIQKGAQFKIDQAKDHALHHGLSGEGNLFVSLGHTNRFTIDPTAQTTGFNGEVIMNRGIVDLNRDYFTHLKQAGLTLRQLGVAEVGSGLSENDRLSHLTIQGGRLDFSKQSSLESLKVDRLEMGKNSTIQVSGLNQLDDNLTAGDEDFFEQQNGYLGDYLVEANHATSNSDQLNITLVDSAGKEIAVNDKEQLATVQLDDRGTADYIFKGAQLITGSQDAGIALHYGLYRLNANEGKQIHLEDSGETRHFGAVLSGKGGYTIKANHADGITLGNSASNYSGDTIIEDGKVTLTTSMALGQRGDLYLNNRANLDFRYFSHTMDNVYTDLNSTLNLNSASLLLFDGGEIKGKLLGGNSALIRVSKETENGGKLTIHGANSTFSGRAMAQNGGNLILKNIEGLGSAQIILKKGTLTFDGIDAGNKGFNNFVQGDQASSVTIDNNASILFNKDFIDHKGRFDILSGTLTVAHQRALGSAETSDQNQVNIGKDGVLIFDEQFGSRANTFTGEGLIKLKESQLHFTGNYERFVGTIDLDSQSEFYLNRADATGSQNLSPYQLHHYVTGDGLFNVILTNKDHEFRIDGKDYFSEFRGDLALTNALINISNETIDQLSHATLVLNSGALGDISSVVTTEDHSLHSLSLNGGAIKLGSDGDKIHTLYVDQLDLSAGSTIMVDRDIHDIDLGSIDRNNSYFDQQYTQKGTTLVSAKELMDDINNISINLVDYDGNAISSKEETHDIKRGDYVIGKGYYQYKGIAVDGKKGEAGEISLSYGLTKLEAMDTYLLDLINNGGKNVNELGIILTGKGGFNFQPTDGDIYVGNTDSDYTGATNIMNGNVIATADNAFGLTSTLNIEDESHVNLQRYKQKAGTVVLGSGSSLDLGTGELILMDGDSVVNGQVAGANDHSHLSGDLRSRIIIGDEKSDGTFTSASLVVNGTNSDFKGLVVVRGDNELQFNHEDALLNGRVHLQQNGELTLDFDGALKNTITGHKETMVTIADNAKVTMGQNFKNSAFLGTYNILGEAKLDNVISIVRNDMIGTGTLHLTNGSMLKYDGNFVSSGSNQEGFTGTVDIDNDSIFGILRDDQYSLQHDLKGAGEYFVSLQETDLLEGGNREASHLEIYDLDLGEGHLTNFEGTINLDAGRLHYSDQLSDKIGITVGRWGHFTVGNDLTGHTTGGKDLRALTLRGGLLEFSSTANRVTPIITNDLHVQGENRVVVQDIDGYRQENAFDLYVDQDENYFDQQVNFTGQWLVKADNATSDVGSIILVKPNGEGEYETIDVGESVASVIDEGTAYYNYNGAGVVTEGDEQGISLSYGLTQLDVNEDKTILLTNAQSKIDNLQIILSGKGNSEIKAADDRGIVIGNNQNSYEGKTLITSGTVTTASDNAFGKTSELNLGDNVTLHFGNNLRQDDLKRASYTQEVGSLVMAESSELNLHTSQLTITEESLNIDGTMNLEEGHLIIQNDAMINGALTSRDTAILDIESGSDTTITGVNRDFHAETSIADGASLTLTNSDAVGDARLEVDGVLNLSTDGADDDGIFDNLLTGKESGAINIVDQGDITLMQDNRDYLGSFSIESGSQLTATDNYALGNENAITNEGTLNLVGLTGEHHNQLSGEGVYNLENSQIDLMADFSTDMGAINLNDQSNLTIKGEYDHYDQTITIDETSQFTIDQEKDFSINHGLAGKGKVDVTLGSTNKLSLTSDDIHGFEGNLILNSGEIDLNSSNDHIAKLSDATLTLNADGTAKVGGHDKSDKLNSLALAGGTIHFTEENPETLEVGKLTVESGSSIMLKDEGIVADSEVIKDIDSSIPLIDQQSGVTGKILVQADELDAASVGSQVILVDEDNVEIKSGAEASLDITNGKAHYDYKGVYVANEEGTKGAIALTYGLTKLEADPNLSITITNSQYSGGKENQKLGVILTGDGGFTFDNHSVFYVGNDKSDYKGDTLVTGGKIFAASDNAFGNTAHLTLENDAEINLIEHKQTVGKLTTSDDSIFKIEMGELTVTNGGVIDGQLDGKKGGALNVTGGDLTINSNNGSFQSKTTITGDESQLILTQVDALGSAAITLKEEGEVTYQNIEKVEGDRQTIQNSLEGDEDTVVNIIDSHLNLLAANNKFKGTLKINDNGEVLMNDYGLVSGNIENEGDLIIAINGLNKEYSGQLTGTGSLVKTGEGFLEITADQHYGGDISIVGGSIEIYDEINFTTDKNVDLLGGNLVLQDKAIFTAGDGINVYQDGLIRLLGEESRLEANLDIHSGGSLGGYGTVKGDVNNAGTIYVGSRSLSTDDDVTGSNPESQQVGQLTIDGDYHGSGALSSLYFGSEFSDDSSISDHLVITGKATGHSNVYVNSIKDLGKETDRGIELIEILDYAQSDITFTHKGRTVDGIYEYTLQKDEEGHWFLSNKLGGNGGDPNLPGDGGTVNIRPEVGGYLANHAVANTLFNHSLHNREYIDGYEGAWMRMGGSFGRSKDRSDQIRTKTDTYSMQLGVDLFSTMVDGNPFKFGIMGGFGSSKSKMNNELSGRRSKADSDGFALGLYGTLGEADRHYIDAWIQYVQMDNKIEGGLLPEEKYKSKGFVASIEGGYAFNLTDSLYLQPQAQLTYMGVKNDDYTEANGTNVRSNRGNLQLRLGARLFNEYTMKNGETITPYMEVNYIHNSKPARVYFDDYISEQRGAKNIGEVKIGVESKVGNNLKVWGDFSHSRGSNRYRDTKVSAGIRYTF